jgi:hypothetical protein
LQVFKGPDGCPVVVKQLVNDFLQTDKFQDHGAITPRFRVEAWQRYQANVKNPFQRLKFSGNLCSFRCVGGCPVEVSCSLPITDDLPCANPSCLN